MKHESKLGACSLTRRALLRQGAALSAVPLFPRCTANQLESSAFDDSMLRRSALPAQVAGVRVPDSRVARAAADLVRSVSSETLYNHCMRSYVFAALSFKAAATRFDHELVFLASVMHDLGLVDDYMSETERFEVDGADAAVAFLEQWHVPQDKLETIWDAIALHTCVGIVTRKRPDIAAVAIGSGMDVAGIGLEQLAAADIDEVLKQFPRLGQTRDAIDTMLRLCEKKPGSVMMTPVAEVGRRHIPQFAVPTVEDIMLAAPFAE